MPELDRRDFMKLVGLGGASAAAAGCSDPIENLVPYVVQPEEVTPGIATYYASTAPTGEGVYVKTREGRPILLDGNPDHPINQGALSTPATASSVPATKADEGHDAFLLPIPRYLDIFGAYMRRVGLDDDAR